MLEHLCIYRKSSIPCYPSVDVKLTIEPTPGIIDLIYIRFHPRPFARNADANIVNMIDVTLNTVTRNRSRSMILSRRKARVVNKFAIQLRRIKSALEIQSMDKRIDDGACDPPLSAEDSNDRR